MTGSRGWIGRPRIWWELYKLATKVRSNEDYRLTVVHGDCPQGADRLVKMWVQAEAELWQPVIITEEPHPADWKIGRQAGMLRNQYMVDLGADLCLAFIRDASRGASDCLSRALAAGIECKVFHEWSEGSTDD